MEAQKACISNRFLGMRFRGYTLVRLLECTMMEINR